MKIVIGRTQIVGTVTVFAFFMLFQVYAYLHYNFALLALGAGLALLLAFYGRRHVLQKELSPDGLIILAVIITMTLTFPFALHRTPASLYHYTIGVLSVLAAYVFSRYPRETCKSLGLTIATVQVLTIGYLLTTTNTVLPLDHMIEGSSSNGITSVLVVLQAVYTGVCFHVERRAPILTSFATLYICLEGFSRGSILTAAMICAAALVAYVLAIRSPARRLVVIVAAALVLAFFVPRVVGVVSDYVLNTTKLAQGLVDPARVEMHSDYLGKLNFWTVLTGTDFSGTSIEDKYNGNPHSSMIRAHHLFGIFYLFAIMGSLMLGVLAARTRKGLLVTAGLTSIILFRSLSEPVLFPTPMDFFVFLFLFIAIDDGRNPRPGRGQVPIDGIAGAQVGSSVRS